MAYTLFSFPHLTSSYENSRKKTAREEMIRISKESKNEWHKIIGNTYKWTRSRDWIVISDQASDETGKIAIWAAGHSCEAVQVYSIVCDKHPSPIQPLSILDINATQSLIHGTRMISYDVHYTYQPKQTQVTRQRTATRSQIRRTQVVGKTLQDQQQFCHCILQ